METDELQPTPEPTAKSLCGMIDATNLKPCGKPRLCQGYCSSHYQLARKHGWPRPCPADGFTVVPRPRGRPRKTPKAA